MLFFLCFPNVCRTVQFVRLHQLNVHEDCSGIQIFTQARTIVEPIKEKDEITLCLYFSEQEIRPIRVRTRYFVMPLQAGPT